MPNYLFVFYGGMMPENPRDQKKMMDTWMAWFAKLGNAIVEKGSPTIPGKIVRKSGVRAIGANPITGYTVVKAASMDKAVEMAKGCPGVADGSGQLAIYELANM